MIINKIFSIIKWIVVLFFSTTILAVIAFKYLPIPFTPLMLIRCGQQIAHGEDLKMKHKWVPLSEMSKYLPVAVIASEDQLYLQHNGFDFNAISSALQERKDGKRQRGGSTISQQTAKNVFLWPSSTWVRKGFEVYFTLLIENIWGKERIMEVYLNSIEMGPGIYGAEAVAREHFGTTACQLSRAQCALIAATLPNPIRFSSAEPSRYMLRRQTAIMHQMRHIPLFEITAAKKEE